jgi:hypothetical protein
MCPRDEYSQRLAARELRVSEGERWHIRIGNLRLLLVIAGAAMAWLSFSRHAFSPWWLMVPALWLAGLVVIHSRVLRAQLRAGRAAAVYRGGMARIDDRWAGTGQAGERFRDLPHTYAADLDIFGRGGLFELLSNSRTRMGEDMLAQWLLSPAAENDIRERQEAVRELRGQLDLREDLAVLGQEAGPGVHPEALLHWAEAPSRLEQKWIGRLAPLLALMAVGTATVWGVWGIKAPFFAVLSAEAIVAYRTRKHVEQVVHNAEHEFADLDLLSGVLARLEQETFGAARLQALARELRSHQLPGSLAIARLRTIVQLSESRHHLILQVLDLPLMYSLLVALAAERWRRSHGGAVRRWLQATGEIEALISLSTYSFEHPGDPFPELVAGPPCFAGEELGHPLLPAAVCVRNDVSLSGATRVLLVSGSNMSGKSTLLRTVGINTVLAMAGAPVRARRLCLTPLRVGASIRVTDSLQGGSSRFYAEISRLRKLFDLAAGNPPLLFLLDELLQGTHSSDRRIGAEGILHALLRRGTIGLVSTHDLALTDIRGPAGNEFRNMHFQDEFQNGAIHFDYKLRDGIVAKSNGLELMRSIGLEV